MSRYKTLPQKFQVELTSQPKNWSYVPPECRPLLDRLQDHDYIETYYPSGHTDNLVAIKARVRKAYLIYLCGIPLGLTFKQQENLPKVSSQKVLSEMVPLSTNKLLKMDYEQNKFLTLLT
jgi:hypothetical protein